MTLVMHSGRDTRDTRHFNLETASKPESGETTPIPLPKKLGDGNFGIVLAARSLDGTKKYALKIIYDHVVPNRKEDRTLTYTSDLARVKAELSIGVDLPARLQAFLADHDSDHRLDDDFRSVAESPEDHIVLPIAFSEQFTDFEGKVALEQLDVRLSCYAYLMKRYDWSLKDLVEKAAKDSAHNDHGQPAAQEDERERPATGYLKLQQVVVREKERSAIPILEQIARGLQTLHAAGFRHQDIKPANVYYRRDASRVEFRLGDLGFLRPTDDPAIAGSAVAREPLVLGTRHYRSIEQLDFCDTAECDVLVCDDGARAILTSRDPKFMDTHIRKGDFAYFSKSHSRQLFNITDLKKNASARLVTVEIELSQPHPVPEDAARAEPGVLANDRNTQVAFLKNPTAKTDLFGLGAILFDILSAGDSPERFYELLRRFDTKTVSINRNIVRLYDTWRVGIVDDPDIAAIFGRVCGSRRQAVHIEVLRFLLKCMMSNASDSFYARHGFDKAEAGLGHATGQITAVAAWSKVIAKIRALERAVGAKGYEIADKNILTRKDWETLVWKPDADHAPDLRADTVPCTDLLDKYRQGVAPVARPAGPSEHSPDARLRWPLGAEFLHELVKDLTVRLDEAKSGRRREMFSLAPEHIAVGSRSISLHRRVVKGDERSLIDCMRKRDPLLSGIRPFTHRYEPIWWPYRTRRVKLEIGKVTKRADNVEVKAQIEYSDFSVSGLRLDVGDFVLPTETASPVIFRVAKVLEDGLLLLTVDDDRTSSGASPGALRFPLEDGFLVKSPDRIDYYAGMLAIYMFHILISDGTTLNSDVDGFPAAVYPQFANYPVGFKVSPGERFHSAVPRFGSRKGIAPYTSDLIMWLSLGGYHYGGESRRERLDEKARWKQVFSEVERWRSTMKAHSGFAILDLRRGLDAAEDTSKLKKPFFDRVDGAEWESACNAYLKTAVRSVSV